MGSLGAKRPDRCLAGRLSIDFVFYAVFGIVKRCFILGGGAGLLRYRTGFGVDAEVNTNVAVNSSRLFQATDGVHKPLYHTWRLNLYRSDP